MQRDGYNSRITAQLQCKIREFHRLIKLTKNCKNIFQCDVTSYLNQSLKYKSSLELLWEGYLQKILILFFGLAKNLIGTNEITMKY